MSFFITSIAYYPDHPDKKRGLDKPHKHTSTYGHFPTLKKAQAAVKRNEGGMDECLYNYLVIEEVAYGVYGRLQLADPDDLSKGEWWYRWEHPDGQQGHWVAMDKPDWSKKYYGWGMS